MFLSESYAYSLIMKKIFMDFKYFFNCDLNFIWGMKRRYQILFLNKLMTKSSADKVLYIWRIVLRVHAIENIVKLMSFFAYYWVQPFYFMNQKEKSNKYPKQTRIFLKNWSLFEQFLLSKCEPAPTLPKNI